MPVLGWPKRQEPDIDRHGHLGLNDGGDLDEYLRLDRTAAQGVVGPVSFAGQVTLTDLVVNDSLAALGGLSVGSDAFLVTDDGDISLFDGTYIHQIPIAGLTDGRTWGWPDANGSFLCEGNAPKIARNYRQTAQTAAIASFNLLTAPAAGAYRVTAYIETTALTVAGTYDIPIGYTDAAGATSQKTISGIAVSATGRTVGTPVLIEVASGNVTAQVDVGLLTGTYNVRIIAERLP